MYMYLMNTKCHCDILDTKKIKENCPVQCESFHNCHNLLTWMARYYMGLFHCTHDDPDL